MSISAAYWLVNRTGLPLVFRAEGGAAAAGQGPEHELARAVAPLLFAFAEPDASPTVAARLGTSIAPNQEVPYQNCLGNFSWNSSRVCCGYGPFWVCRIRVEYLLGVWSWESYVMVDTYRVL